MERIAKCIVSQKDHVISKELSPDTVRNFAELKVLVEMQVLHCILLLQSNKLKLTSLFNTLEI